MPIQTDVTLVLAHADRSHSETAHLHLPLCLRDPAQSGGILGYTAPLRSPRLLPGARPCGHWAYWCDPRVGGSYLRGRAALQAQAARGERRGGQPRGSELARSSSGAAARGEEREGKGEGEGGRRRELREAQGLSQARQAGRESALRSWVRAPCSKGPLPRFPDTLEPQAENGTFGM